MKATKQHFFEIKTNYSCNLNCVFCWFGDRDRRMMPFDDVVGNLKYLKGLFSDPNERHEYFLNVSGGEPTIRKDCLAIMRAISEMNFSSICLHTNAINFAQEAFAKEVSKYIAKCYVSFPASTAQRHREVSRKDNKWDDVLRGIKNMKKFGIEVMTNTLITRYNDEQLTEIARLLVSLHVDTACFNFPIPKARAQMNIDDLLAPSCLHSSPFVRQARQILEAHRIPFILTDWPGFPACFRAQLLNEPLEDVHHYDVILKETICVDIDHQYENYTTLYAMQFEKDILAPVQCEECASCVLQSVCCGVHRSLYHRAGFELKPYTLEIALKQMFGE